MIVGKVVGSIVSTRKSEKLIGNKFMIVEPVHHMKAEHSQIVAIDIIGAGIGEYVSVVPHNNPFCCDISHRLSANSSA